MKHDTPLTGAELIAAERLRQVQAEGWTPAHDDQHDDDSLLLAAICYASPVPLYVCDIDSRATVRFVDPWPDSWDSQWDKRSEYGNADETDSGIADPESYTPEQQLDLLVKAGALIAAEIDRRKRALGVGADHVADVSNMIGTSEPAGVAAAPATHKLAPIEPTPAMMEAAQAELKTLGWFPTFDFRAAYQAALSVLPAGVPGASEGQER